MSMVTRAAPLGQPISKYEMNTPARFIGFKSSCYLVMVAMLGLNPAVGPRVWAQPPSTHARAPWTLEQIPFNGQRAYEFLIAVCEIGPRVSGSEGMKRQQKMLTEHFTRLGGIVSMQEFAVSHPETREPVQLANMIVRWHPQRKQRILLCAHYDTRPFPDQDPVAARRRDPFLGANDGASGVALLAELAYHMPDLESKYGIDFVLFDAEEFVFSERRDPYFLGSIYFARQYRRQTNGEKYRLAVLFDMIADRDLQIPQDAKSMSWPDSRPIVLSIWRTARRLGVTEFQTTLGPDIRDDHLPLHDIGGIPACDIIDFNYGTENQSYWHTVEDTPDKCSALSLAKVGWVILTWLEGLK